MESSRSVRIITLAALLLSAAGLLVPPQAASAQYDAQRYELIAEVNGLRASWGLLPYSIDAGLMAMAQEHAAYQASIHQSTHQHRDGSSPPDLGVVENVAGGKIGWLDPSTAVNEVWSDLGHLRTMVAFAQGSMGVGIADDGKTVYYVLEVRPTPESAATAGPGPDFPRLPTVNLSQVTAQAVQPLITTTPRPDGSLIHVVGYGQTLWAIALAYGVTVDQIRAWNNIAPDSNEIYEGQRLLVRLPQPTGTAGPPAPTLPATPTMPPSTVQSPEPSLTVPVGLAGASAMPARIEPAGGQALQPSAPAAGEPSGAALPVLAAVITLAGIGLAALALLLRQQARGR